MSPRRSILVLAAATLLATPALAMRVVAIEVMVDGKVHLRGHHGDNGNVSKAAVWRYLRNKELGVVQGVTIAPDADNSLRATLRGDITVDVHYGGKATVKELHLVRKSPTANWMIDPDEVEQMAKDIGLEHVGVALPDHGDGPQTNPPPPDRTLLWVAVTGFFLFVIGTLVFLLVWGRRPGRTDPRPDADS